MPVRFADIAWPTARSYWLVNARVPACVLAGCDALLTHADGEGVVKVDLLVKDGLLARIEATPIAYNDEIARVDLGGRQIWPTLVDVHTHLDKGHTVERNPNVDGTFLNAHLVKQGFAQTMTIPPNVKHNDLFLKLQKEARDNHRGLWK